MLADSVAITRKPERAFALWVVAMLLVVLLSAMPAGAEARTRLVGSAFDPTTVSVALSPKQPKAKVTAQSADRRRVPTALADGAAKQLAVAPFAPLVLRPAARQSPKRAAGPGVFPAARALTRAHGPRAPPRA